MATQHTSVFQDEFSRAQEQLPDSLLRKLARMGIERRRLGFGSSHTVVVYPPLVTLVEKGKDRGDLAQDLGDTSVDLYIHVPFCEFHCDFCHYKSMPYRDNPERIDRVVQGLLLELGQWRSSFEEAVGALSVRSIYIGGGTGFILPLAAMQKLVDGVLAAVTVPEQGLAFCVESSSFALCADAAREKLEYLHGVGLSRVSIGVQTLDEQVLTEATRATCSPRLPSSKSRSPVAKLADRAVRLAASYVDELNVDLMQDISEPYSVDTAAADVEWVVRRRVPSLTYYVTRYHTGSRGYARQPSYLPSLDSTRTSASIRLAAIAYLQSRGYAPGPGGRFHMAGHRDVFKEARISQEGRLLGLGVSAYSRFGPHMFRNVGNLDSWLNQVQAAGSAIESYHFVTPTERAEGEIIARIRDSIPMRDLRDLAAGTASPAQTLRLVDQLLEHGLLQKKNGVVQMTPLGRAFEEEICWLFYSEEKRRASDALYQQAGP